MKINVGSMIIGILAGASFVIGGAYTFLGIREQLGYED